MNQDQESQNHLPSQTEIEALTSQLLSTIRSESESHSHSHSQDSTLSSALISSLTPQFLALKSLHHSLQESLSESKARVASSREKVDEKTLTLNNLKYERNQLKKQIEICRDFHSIYQEVPLCSIEEFYRDCDLQELKDQNVQQDAHQLVLARLKWELVQRQRREADRQSITASKAIVVKQNKEKRMKLDQLDDQLKEMHSTAKKIEASLEDF